MHASLLPVFSEYIPLIIKKLLKGIQSFFVINKTFLKSLQYKKVLKQRIHNQSEYVYIDERLKIEINFTLK